LYASGILQVWNKNWKQITISVLVSWWFTIYQNVIYCLVMRMMWKKM